MNFSRLVKEWAWRVNDGMPDPKNRTHVEFLRDVLRESGYSEDFVVSYTQNLTEEETFKARSTKGDKQIVVYKSKENMEKAIEDGNAEPLEKDDSKPDGKEKEVDNSKLSAKDGDFERTAGKDKKEPKKSTNDNLFGDLSVGDNQDKSDIMKYGFDEMEKKTGNKPAPGNNGSAFNEVSSGLGQITLDKNPNMTEQELAQQTFDTFGQTKLGQLQSKSQVGQKNIPDNLKEALSSAKDSGNKEAIKKANQQINTYTKCLISARSAITKHKQSLSRIEELQKSGKFGKPGAPQTFYGTEKSLQSQKDAVDNANTVILPNGIEVSKDDAKMFIDMGGGGKNPSDTATFYSDENGTLLIQFHSDKTSTGDILGSKTVSAENRSILNRINNNKNLSDEQKKRALEIVNSNNSTIREIEEGYQDQTISVAKGLKNLPIENQVAAIQEISKAVPKDYLGKAIIGKNGIKKQYVEYVPEGADPENLTDAQKYEMVRNIVADGKGNSDDVKIISKVTKKVTGDMKDVPDEINISKILSKQRKTAVETIRKRRDELDKIDQGPPPLGIQQELEEIIEGFHLGVIDDLEYDSNEPDENKRMEAIMNSCFDVNMGGTLQNKDTLRKALGVNNTDELREKFNVEEVEEFTYSDKEKTIVTGKKVFTYIIGKEDGEKIELGFKTYRSTDGATGKSRTTIAYSTEFQKILKGIK